jgi:hypothetical protein
MWTGTWLIMFWMPLSWLVAYATGYVVRSVSEGKLHFCDECGSVYDPERAAKGGRGAYAVSKDVA